MYSKLQYISQGSTASDQLSNIQSALDAGCNWIQLRAKNFREEDLIPLAEKVKTLCTQYAATFIINDHPSLVIAADADGVHLGLADMPVAAARTIVGNKFIGGTANTLAHILQRVDEGCNYVGFGPYRFTTTKEKLSPIVGLQGYQNIMDSLKGKNINIPVYAIGGILPADVADIMETGVHGIAVSGIITHHNDKTTLIQQLNTSLYETVSYRR